MCLYPKLIKNKKYESNKKNGGHVPPINDKRTMYVPIACGNCMECMKRKSNDWRVRLNEEIRENKVCTFVTLTLSNENYKELYKEVDNNLEVYDIDNEIATKAIRRFLERWRFKYKKSIKHWLVTELGHNGTENIHLHGLIWSDNIKEIEEIWKYGYVFCGDFVNEKTINYIIKYIHKIDEKHKYYKPKILTSKGIGNSYINRKDAKNNTYKENNTKEYYTTRSGIKLSLPIYYRNKIYNDEEREKLWINKLDKNIRYVDGTKIEMNTNEEEYIRSLKEARNKNIRLGYKDDKINWNEKDYEEKRREIMQLKRIMN